MNTPSKIGHTIEVHVPRNDVMKVDEYPRHIIGPKLNYNGIIKPVHSLMNTKQVYKMKNY
jgi:hypothetical protein